jgi:hypothetical protein
MTGNEQIAALLATIEDLAQQAKQDAELSERLLADPAAAVAEAAGHPVPPGVTVTAQRNSDGAVELKAEADPNFDGELDDSRLDAVAGGLRRLEGNREVFE